MVKEYADSLGIPFLETSARSGFNVEQIFSTIANEIYRAPLGAPRESGRITISNNSQKKKCCS
eukprot:gene5648-6518_t